jgi:hypothetical protein
LEKVVLENRIFVGNFENARTKNKVADVYLAADHLAAIVRKTVAVR